MLNYIKTFARDEDGAVTVDWVVLTAAIVGLGLLVIASVRNGAVDIAGDIGKELTKFEVGQPTPPAAQP